MMLDFTEKVMKTQVERSLIKICKLNCMANLTVWRNLTQMLHDVVYSIILNDRDEHKIDSLSASCCFLIAFHHTSGYFCLFSKYFFCNLDIYGHVRGC